MTAAASSVAASTAPVADAADPMEEAEAEVEPAALKVDVVAALDAPFGSAVRAVTVLRASALIETLVHSPLVAA